MTQLQLNRRSSHPDLRSHLSADDRLNFALTASLTSELAYFKKQLSEALDINTSLKLRNRVLEATAQYRPAYQPQPTWKQPQQKEKDIIKIEEDEVDSQQRESSPTPEVKGKRQAKERKLRFGGGEEIDHNQTKNIPKNYGKAMLSFIQKNIHKYTQLIKPILKQQNYNVIDLLNHIKKYKRYINSIIHLKHIWGHQNPKNSIFKCIRILSFEFMRKHCLEYIFNSRIKNHATHVKYRKKILEGILEPHNFTCIKEY